jgi:hypothetical protein
MGIEAAIIGSAVVGGAMQSRGAKKAASAQAKAAEQQQQLERQMFERQIELQQPFRQIGLENLNKLAALYGEGGAFSRAPTMDELSMDPGYAFRLAEGEKALARMQAARGQYLGGGAIRAGTRYGQEMGSQEFQNAYNRALQQRASVTNVLSSLGGLGPVATGEMGGAASRYAAGAGQAIGTAGQARASGYIGSANALANALGQAATGYGLAQGGYFDRIGGSTAPAAALAPPSAMTLNYMGPRFGGLG